MQRKQMKQSRGAATLSRLRAAGNRVSSRTVSPAAAAAGIFLTVAAAGAMLAYSEKSAQSAHEIHTKLTAVKGKNTKTSAVSAQPNVKAGVQTKDSKTATVAAASSGRRPVDFYTGDVRATMFSEPVAPAPPAPVVVESAPVAPEPPDPYADYNFTGSATIGDEKFAIVENIETHDGYLLKVGDSIPDMDSKVESIDGRYLTFSGKDAKKTLSVSMNTSYIPLSASAGFLAAKPQGQPGQGGLAGLAGMTPQQLAALAAAAMAAAAGGRGGGRGRGFGGGAWWIWRRWRERIRRWRRSPRRWRWRIWRRWRRVRRVLARVMRRLNIEAPVAAAMRLLDYDS